MASRLRKTNVLGTKMLVSAAATRMILSIATLAALCVQSPFATPRRTTAMTVEMTRWKHPKYFAVSFISNTRQSVICRSSLASDLRSASVRRRLGLCSREGRPHFAVEQQPASHSLKTTTTRSRTILLKSPNGESSNTSESLDDDGTDPRRKKDSVRSDSDGSEESMFRRFLGPDTEKTGKKETKLLSINDDSDKGEGFFARFFGRGGGDEIDGKRAPKEREKVKGGSADDDTNRSVIGFVGGSEDERKKKDGEERTTANPWKRLFGKVSLGGDSRDLPDEKAKDAVSDFPLAFLDTVTSFWKKPLFPASSGSSVEEQSRLDAIRESVELQRTKRLQEAERRKQQQIEEEQIRKAKLQRIGEERNKLLAERIKLEQKKKEARERQKVLLEAVASSKETEEEKKVQQQRGLPVPMMSSASDPMKEEPAQPSGNQEETVGSLGKKNAEARKLKTSSNAEARKLKTSSNSGMSKNALGVISGLWDSVSTGDEQWLVVCPKTRISPGETVPVVAGGLDLLLIASRDGKKLYCVANTCPHLGTPLETGLMERRKRPPAAGTDGKANVTGPPDGNFAFTADDGCEECIVCPLHQTAFALESGEVRGEWCPHPPVIGPMMGAVKPPSSLPTFSVRVRGKNIEVLINSALDGGDVTQPVSKTQNKAR